MIGMGSDRLEVMGRLSKPRSVFVVAALTGLDIRWRDLSHPAPQSITHLPGARQAGRRTLIARTEPDMPLVLRVMS